MITSVDTNILLDVLRPNPAFVDRSLASLENARNTTQVVVCPIVYTELSAHFEDKTVLDTFLNEAVIQVLNFSSETCFMAGRVWVQYRQQGGTRERILPDFLIGAHALSQASKLLTRDRGFYKKYFQDLVVIEP